jgi:ubiquinone biosynthesis protein
MEVHDWDKILSGLSQLINRLSLSVIVAALVIGLAILITTIASGTPLHNLITIGFLGIIVFGIWLLVSILRGR